MDQPQMLEKMCKVELTKAEITAIGRSRGFSPKETASPTLQVTLWLSVG